MNLRRCLLLILLATSAAAFGQGISVTALLTSSATTCTPATPGTACLIYQVGASTNTVAATLGGTFSATLQFEASGDGASTWVSVAATPSSGGSSVTSATGTGTWQIQAGGYSYLRIRCSTYTSGTVIATLNPSRAGTTSASSGGGTVGANSGTAGAVTNYPAAGGSTTVAADQNLIDNGTQWVFAEQLQVPVGSLTTPSIRATGAASNTGIEVLSASTVFDYAGSAFESMASAGIIDGNAEYFAWSSTAASSGTVDTTLCRQGAGVVEIGSGTSCASTGSLKVAAHISAGTTFTSSGGCTEGTLVGGATAGKFTTSGSTSCSTTITMGNSATAPNGWECSAHDLTTAADVTNPHMTASTATTVTIATGTIVSGDVISFGCIGY